MTAAVLSLLPHLHLDGRISDAQDEVADLEDLYGRVCRRALDLAREWPAEYPPHLTTEDKYAAAQVEIATSLELARERLADLEKQQTGRAGN
jgi:hypothetical protein